MKTRTAAEVMNPEVVAVEPDMTVHELAAFLTERQITGAPVVEAGGRVVGVVSETDIAEAGLDQAEALDDRSDPARDVRAWDESDREETRELNLRVTDNRTVRDIMTPAAYTIPHDTTVAEVARTMVTGRVHRLLVTRGGRVVGIVTTLDLLKLLYAEPRRAAKTTAKKARKGKAPKPKATKAR